MLDMPPSYRATKRSDPDTKRTFEGKTLYAKIISVYDGDTVTVSTRLQRCEEFKMYSVRLAGIDTPEVRGVQRSAGLVVRDALWKELPIGSMVIIDFDKEEKYGRLMGTVWTLGGGWLRRRKRMNINKWLVQNGYALEYDGGTKTEFTCDHLNRIITSCKR